MRRLGYTADQVRAAERPLLDAGAPLMRRAASGLAAELRRELAAPTRGADGILLLAGSGDNGGDGLWAVAELAGEGVPVRVVPVGSRLHDEGAAAARGAGARFETGAADDPSALAASLGDGELVLDAIVGIGAHGAGLRGPAHEVVAALLPVLGGRRARRTVVAVDLPSGIGPDDGSVPEDGVLLPADVTVTFGAIKAGALLPPAAGVVGELRLIDIGLDLDGVEPAVRAG